MSKRKDSLKPELNSGELLLLRACLAIALCISAFLAWSSLQGGGIPGCGPESGCDKVLNSRWAYVFNLPISLFAVPVYVALITVLRPRGTNWKTAAVLASVVLFSALWFVGLQAFALRAFCKFCMVAHVAGVLAGILILRRASLRLSAYLSPVVFGAGAAAILMVAQLLGKERGPTQIASSTPSPMTVTAPAISKETSPPPLTNASATSVQTPPDTNLPTVVVEAPFITNSPVVLPQTLAILDGEFKLDFTKVPVTGPPGAPKKMAKLFDYTCHHCRDLHHLLSAFRTKYSNQLAVVSLPLPLDSQCNPIVKRTMSAHVNACQYASYGLAVFHADPAKFEEFTEFVFAEPRPPDLARARRRAGELVGPEKFEQALQNPAVSEQIQTDIAIYTASYRKHRSGQLPQMYFETGSSLGAVPNQAALEDIMATRLGFPRSTN